MSKSLLRDRLSFEYGFAVRINDEPQGQYPVFGSNGITGFIDSYKVEGQGVIVGRKGSVGKVTYSNGSFTPTDTAYYLRLKDHLSDDLKFWFYYLPLLGLEKLNTHSAVPGLSREIAYFIEVDPPSKDTQQKIAAVLSALDAKIELNNRINTELEAMAKTLYDYWFVQFDFPDKNGKPYKSSGGKMDFNQRLQSNIPEGWKVKELGQVLKTMLGGTPYTKEASYWKNADIPWLSSGEIACFPIINSNQFITQKGIDNSAAVLLPKGSVVISIVRYIRPSILAIDACTNQSVVGITETDELKNAFLYPYLCSQVSRLMSLRTGAQQPHINKGVIDESLIIIPSSETLTKYYKCVNPVYKKILNTAFENQQLIQLRDWLLPMLMNGQVRVD